MELQKVMNSPGLWIASSFMVIFIVILGIVYFKMGLKRAKELGIEKERYIPAIRSAAITSIGPSLSPVIVLLSMIAVVGAPTPWYQQLTFQSYPTLSSKGTTQQTDGWETHEMYCKFQGIV